MFMCHVIGRWHCPGEREEPISTQMIKKCSEEQDEEEEDLGLDEEIDENDADGEDE